MAFTMSLLASTNILFQELFMNLGLTKECLTSHLMPHKCISDDDKGNDNEITLV